MKTLALIACLLGVVYCANQTLENWYNDVTKCTQETSKPANDPDTIYCVLGKQNLIDGQGKYIIGKMSAFLDQIIADEAKRNQAKEIVTNCYNSVEYIADKEINVEQTKKGITCSLPAVAMIDKL